MNELLQTIDLSQLLSAVWTLLLLPLCTFLGKQILDWLGSKKLDQYALILYEEVIKAVKCVYETEIKEIKHTADWTPAKQNEVKTLAKEKVVQALTTGVYRCLKKANPDFEQYLDSLIGTALYDVKKKS